jgi:hypothetical protein
MPAITTLALAPMMVPMLYRRKLNLKAKLKQFIKY